MNQAEKILNDAGNKLLWACYCHWFGFIARIEGFLFIFLLSPMHTSVKPVYKL